MLAGCQSTYSKLNTQARVFTRFVTKSQKRAKWIDAVLLILGVLAVPMSSIPSMSRLYCVLLQFSIIDVLTLQQGVKVYNIPQEVAEIIPIKFIHVHVRPTLRELGEFGAQCVVALEACEHLVPGSA